jgi:hypothetical protein
VYVPTQQIKYLGFLINSVDMTISLPDEKIVRLRRAVRKALKELNNGRTLTVRIAAKTIGFIISSIPATIYGKAHFRQLEFAKTAQLVNNPTNYDVPFRWTEDCRADLEWWASPTTEFKATFESTPVTTTLITDASLEGWGALWNGEERFGALENDDRHIDELELRAVLQALESFPQLLAHQHRILLRCDNTTAVAYINNMGGRVFRLNRVAQKIWRLLEESGSFMQAVYIPTEENPADALTRGVTSRHRMLDTEVQLNPSLVRDLCHKGPFVPQVDWFASDENHQLPRFYTWHAQARSNAEGVNAFMFDWGIAPGYIFPPFSLLPRIIRKIKDDKAKVLLVHPRWPGALWFPSINEITVTRDSIPQSADVLRYPNHPDLRHPMTDLQLQASWTDGASQTCPRGGQSRLP